MKDLYIARYKRGYIDRCLLVHVSGVPGKGARYHIFRGSESSVNLHCLRTADNAIFVEKLGQIPLTEIHDLKAVCKEQFALNKSLRRGVNAWIDLVAQFLKSSEKSAYGSIV